MALLALTALMAPACSACEFLRVRVRRSQKKTYLSTYTYTALVGSKAGQQTPAVSANSAVSSSVLA